MAEYVVARLKVRRDVWIRLKAEAVLEGISVAELAGRVLSDYTTQFQTEGVSHVKRS